MKADLHVFCVIGFQSYWLKTQGYKQEELLKSVVNSCFSKNLGICAITSEEFDIPRNSVHDRFNYLKNQINSLPEDYSISPIGKNIILVEKDGKKVILLNGQTVIVKDKEKRYDHLVVGSNKIPNLMNLEETCKYCDDRGLVQIAEHPFSSNFGIGEKNLEVYLDYYDAISYDSQLILPEIFAYMPLFGPHFGSASRKWNRKVKEFSQKHKKPYIAVSNAHRIEDIGLSYIEFDKEPSIKTEEDFLIDLKKILREGKFKNIENYECFFGWFNWVYKFQKALLLERDNPQIFSKQQKTL